MTTVACRDYLSLQDVVKCYETRFVHLNFPSITVWHTDIIAIVLFTHPLAFPHKHNTSLHFRSQILWGLFLNEVEVVLEAIPTLLNLVIPTWKTRALSGAT